MNRTLILAFWRERFTSLIRMLLLITLWGFPILAALLIKPIRVPGGDNLLGPMLVLGAGLIGRDLSTGVLQLIMARPVTRLTYVLSRWMALALAGIGVGLLGWLIVLPFSLSSGGMTLSQGLLRIPEIILAAIGISAVLTALSALLPGFGDLALLLIGAMGASLIGFLGQVAKQPAMQRIGTEVVQTLVPVVAFDQLWHEGTFHAYPIVSWASTVTLALLVAIHAMNRREFSYGSAG